jgi:hypothetical protein
LNNGERGILSSEITDSAEGFGVEGHKSQDMDRPSSVASHRRCAAAGSDIGEEELRLAEELAILTDELSSLI